MRSEEEKRLDFITLTLNLEKYEYAVIKNFIESNNYYYAERVMQIMKYFKFLDKFRPGAKRLQPVGGIDGLMFIATNPGEKSMLANVWDDPFGKYFGAMLEEAGIDKNKVWMTNVYKHQTEKNRPLTAKEIVQSVQELEIEMEYVNPKMIVALGKQPTEVLEKYFDDKDWISLPHPSYIHRFNTPENRSKYLTELIKLKKYE